ncbi:hypothetical protein AVEN_44046-1 [Araneus ventricosus]|uniref:Uncharacterized protein n=1 Tax=Araneus ventricosus TaxID=182803 RepID=A0A4Y2H960_ARAVE|nr:hypothetical protein AVEN_44046-1 [Araneus ventricosus]
MRAYLKKDIGVSPAEMLYGQCFDFLEISSKISRHPARCWLRRPSCRGCDSTQESFGLCQILTIRLVMYLCNQNFVHPHTFWFIVIVRRSI